MLRTAASSMALLILISPALADQCAWNQKDVAAAASDVLSKQKLVKEYCKSCGDKAATDMIVKDVRVEQASATDPDSFVVKMNGDTLDLAYTFVPKPNDEKQWANLGLLVKCDDPSSFDDLTLTPSVLTQ